MSSQHYLAIYLRMGIHRLLYIESSKYMQVKTKIFNRKAKNIYKWRSFYDIFRHVWFVNFNCDEIGW